MQSIRYDSHTTRQNSRLVSMMPLLMLAALSQPEPFARKYPERTEQDKERDRRNNQERIDAAQKKRERKAAKKHLPVDKAHAL